MKRFGAIILLVLFLSGCGGTSGEMNRCLVLREKLLKESCSFKTKITADYADKLYHFTLDCKADAQGNLSFTVEEPETISGITGRITGEGGELTFEGTALSFPLMADGQVTPVSAPWLLLKTLRSGYLTSAGKDGDLMRITIDDRYEDDALTMDIWVDREDRPVYAEILWKGENILTITVENFQIV